MMWTRRAWLVAALLSLATFFGTAGPAAAFEFGLKVGVAGGTPQVVTTTTAGQSTLTFNGTLDGVNFFVTVAYTNSPGSPFLGELQLTNVIITNTTGQNKTINISLAANDYVTGL